MELTISAPLLLLLISASVAVSANDGFEYSKEHCVMNTTLPYRLPLSVIPSNYDLDIWPGLDAPYALNGTITVDVDIVMDTTCIVLHQHELLLHDITLSFGSNATVSPIFVELDDDKQFAILYFEHMLSQGPALLRYQYDGYANTDAGGGKGFFVSILELVPPGNSKMFATQFEGPYARSAFPCFDEPSLKATFSSRFFVSLPSYIDSLDDLTVLFNTKEFTIRSDFETNEKEFTFTKTPIPISTYLVAFAIGDFSYLETNSNGVRYRIYCSPGKEQYAEFSLNITVELIEYWGELFGIEYPFNKLDQIAVPKIIEDGMENMGLVTYWPPWLLENGNYSTQGQFEQAAQVIAHELVHMWFGDMVTLPWWSEAYNNEGFARYFQYIGCQYLFPSWDVWEAGSSSYFSFAYNYIVTDSLGVGRSLVVPPGTVSGTVDSVTNMFAGPTYPKGAAVNRMMNFHMGDDDWYAGLAYHLQKNLYGNPTSQSILRDLDEYTGNKYSMTENYMPWLTFTAFPVVKATLDNGVLSLSQTPVSQFMPKYDEAQWFISLDVSFASSGDTQVYTFSDATASFMVSEEGAFIANPMHTGYFVVNYDSDNWADVMTISADYSYDPVQRKLIAQDVFILGRLSHVGISVPSSLLIAYNAVFDSELWSLMLPRYYQVGIALQKESDYATVVEQPAVQALAPLVSYVLDSSNSTSQFAEFQSLILFWDVFFGDETTANMLLSSFENGSQVPAGQLDATYWAAGFYGSEADYNQLTSVYDASTSGSAEMAAAVLGLSATQETNLCQQSLSLFGGDTRISASDKLVNGGQMMRYNRACRGLAWEFVKKESEVLFHQEGSGAATTVLDVVSGIFTSYGEFLDLQRFLALNSAYITEEQIHSTLVQVEINMAIANANVSS